MIQKSQFLKMRDCSGFLQIRSHNYYLIRTPFTVSSLVGTIGHVAHGKSTVVKAISGVQVRSIA